jgi:hypothetical protein
MSLFGKLLDYGKTTVDETFTENSATIFIVCATFGLRAFAIRVFWHFFIVPKYQIAEISVLDALVWLLMYRIFVGEEASRYETAYSCAVGGATRAVGYSIALFVLYWWLYGIPVQ